MVRKSCFFLLICHAGFFFFIFSPLFAQEIGKKYLSNQTATYEEVISFYETLDKKTDKGKLLSYGSTDVGKPLNLFVISSDGDFDPTSVKKKNKRIILINNAIHAGEPDGVDACIKLSEDILVRKLIDPKTLENVVICIIPVYNIDGFLNRAADRRPNQNGPEEVGVRANAKNLDLNRDFIKCDAENTKTFETIFREWDPDIFIDTHVSDGADYQYTMTLISTQFDKLNPVLGGFLKNEMQPDLYKRMEKSGFEMCPYVELYKKTPDDGILGFLETPRYSTGYSTLFNSIGFVTETHMLKPFPKRVESTYQFLFSLVEYTGTNYQKIGELRKEANRSVTEQKQFPIAWNLDTLKWDTFNFKGYEAKYKPSSISGQPRLYYDESSPYTKSIKNYDFYTPVITIEKPVKYIIPQGWKEVIERFEINKVKMKRLASDTMLTVESYYIEDYKTIKNPYEGHYLHYDVKVKKENQQIQYYKGDYIVETNQACNRFIVETLEPQATDSYFCWNFFDAILQQKEGFSDYVFEEKAEEILKQNSEIKKEFDLRKQQDTAFSKNSLEQLKFIHQRSKFKEKLQMRYPVGTIKN
jgi:hypothetical protein